MYGEWNRTLLVHVDVKWHYLKYTITNRLDQPIFCKDALLELREMDHLSMMDG